MDGREAIPTGAGPPLARLAREAALSLATRRFPQPCGGDSRGGL